jgi:hypothetical protein
MNRIHAETCLTYFSKNIRKQLHISGSSKFVPKEQRSVSKTYTNAFGKVITNIAVKSDILNKRLRTVDEYDFIEAMVATAHELKHSELLIQMKDTPLRGCDNNLAESCISRYYNDDTYCYDYDKFSYEIDAERYALREVYDFLHGVMPTWENSDEFLLDYVNARAVDDREAKSEPRKYPYFIQTDTRFTSMEEVFDAFDKAYENSFKVKKDFGSHISESNLVADVLGEHPDLKAGFDNAIDGKEQTHFAACIVYSKHKELGRETKALRNNDYSLQQIRNAAFRERVRNAGIPSLDFDSDEFDEDFTDEIDEYLSNN